MWKIYKHTFPNGKVYIGQTKQSLSKRFGNGTRYDGCPLIAKAIQKYGWENVVTELLEDNISSIDKANELEIYYIHLYDSRNPEKGYNVGYGGGIINKCDDVRILSLWNQGKTQTEIKELLHYDMQTIRLYLDANGVTEEDRLKRRDIINSQKNKQFDDNIIYNLWQKDKSYSEIMSLLNCSRSTIQRALERCNVNLNDRYEKGKLNAIKNKIDKRPVSQYDLDNNYIQTYNSIADANRALGKASNASNIVQVCKGKRKQAYGYKWRYINYE